MKYPPAVRCGSCRLALFIALVTLCAAGGCGPSATEILVVVDSDLDVGTEIDRLTIEITDPGGATRMSEARLGAGEPPLPRSLGMVHEGGPLGEFEVLVRGRLGNDDVVTRTARVSFVPGEIRVLRMFLLRRCLAEMCGRDMTCGDSGCRTTDVSQDELTRWNGEVPRISDGPPMDAGVGVDAGFCPDICNGGCASGTCLIIGATDTPDIRCPDGIPCRIDCTAAMACPRRNHCGEDGSPCVIECSGEGSCERASDCESASTCEIICSGASSCADNNNCKDSLMCSITCSGPDSCGRSQQCRSSGPCVVDCSGDRSCAGQGTCETAACEFLCAGNGVCAGGVSCAETCACRVNCGGMGSCAAPSMCPDGCMSGDGCNATSSACDTCS